MTDFVPNALGRKLMEGHINTVAEAHDDLAKLRGDPPHNHGGNICQGDGIYSASLNRKWAMSISDLEERSGYKERSSPGSMAYVIISNDYPAAVLSSEEAADRFVDKLRQEYKDAGLTSRVHWRSYEFKIGDTSAALAFHKNTLDMAKSQARPIRIG